MKTPMVMLFMAASLAICEGAPKPSHASEPKEVEAIRKKAGKTFTVSLEANHTTGYSWALDGKEDAKVVLQVSNDYVGDAHAPGITGSGGTERWKFRAVKEGTTLLHFLYRRPWEKNTKPIEQRSIRVIVE